MLVVNQPTIRAADQLSVTVPVIWDEVCRCSALWAILHFLTYLFVVVRVIPAYTRFGIKANSPSGLSEGLLVWVRGS